MPLDSFLGMGINFLVHLFCINFAQLCVLGGMKLFLKCHGI